MFDDHDRSYNYEMPGITILVADGCCGSALRAHLVGAPAAEASVRRQQ